MSSTSLNGSINGVHENGWKSCENGVALNHRSLLQKVEQDELHDLVCIGFGPASLAIAVALHDALGERGRSGGKYVDPPKVAFLERQAQFAWHAGMLLPGTKMQISFLKDLATLRNPKSDFTFLNYLHKKDRLVEFANLSTFLPQRIEFEDYLKWCADWFEDVAEYSQEVIQVTPEKSSKGSGAIDSFAITSRHTETGKTTTRRARHVVVAVGGKAWIPAPFPQSHPRVIHSSQYSHAVHQILTDSSRPYRIAVVGSGQSAAEVFATLHSQYPNSQTRLIIKGAALRPSDDSPFVNEIFNPERVDSIYRLSSAKRAASIAEDRNTNYGVVRIELLEHIYETLYTQRIQYSSEAEWPHRILSHRIVQDVKELSAKSGNQLRLRLQDNTDPTAPSTEALDVDLLILATGYTRDAHETLLQSARHLMPNGGRASEKWDVGRDYRVHFAQGKMSPDAGVWLQGCNQDTHGLADSLLSILAVRGGEIVDSIFGGELDLHPHVNGSNGVH
ncbi:L-ornithine N5-oxygenase sida [Rhizodiscina lignyota]|uniref:L-ornithine N(5)-monooxygenase n=1 Tax=Rhizodiscina lignyota TaxID=1504668 RepID=A0A9P4M4R3_9PEZI|nr:L-ornithine N5-oxygenase sida [Rhizodiscina lignyota]